jgi:hypothetical protein
MANIFNQFLKQAGAGTNIKDYRHATRLFVDGNYRLSPKYGFLFHVAFDLNPNLNNLTNEAILESGMLVKSAQLPKFTVDNKTYNAYNRPNVVQTKLRYDPITITFHDDNADTIRSFWWNYYSHYYRDSDHVPQTFAQPSKYSDRQSQNWGYSPAAYASNGAVERMLNSIRVYSLHQRNFTEYTLINPTITNFKFGDHNNNSSNEVMEISMTVAYESVLYSYGQVVPDQTVNGFAILHYDKTPSPLTPQGGGTQSILGPGGLVSALNGVSSQLGQGNWLGAGLTAFKSFNNFKGANFGQIATNELKTIGMNILNGNNPLSKIQIPNFGGASINGTNSFGIPAGTSALLSAFGRSSPLRQNSYYAASTDSREILYNDISQVPGVGGGNNNVMYSNNESVAQAFPVTDYGSSGLPSNSIGETGARGVNGETAEQTRLRWQTDLASYGPNYFAPSGSNSVYATSEGGANFAQGSNPTVDYTSSQFQTQADFDREQAEADAYNAERGNL